MAVIGKKKYQIYLDVENVEFLRSHFETRSNTGGLSGFLDKYVARSVCMIKDNKEIFDSIPPGKMTWKGFWNLCKLQVRLEKKHLQEEFNETNK